MRRAVASRCANPHSPAPRSGREHVHASRNLRPLQHLRRADAADPGQPHRAAEGRWARQGQARPVELRVPRGPERALRDQDRCAERGGGSRFRRRARQAGRDHARELQRRQALLLRHPDGRPMGRAAGRLLRLQAGPAAMALAARTQDQFPHLQGHDRQGHHQKDLPGQRLRRRILQGQDHPRFRQFRVFRAISRDRSRLRQPRDGGIRLLYVLQARAGQACPAHG